MECLFNDNVIVSMFILFCIIDKNTKQPHCFIVSALILFKVVSFCIKAILAYMYTNYALSRNKFVLRATSAKSLDSSYNSVLELWTCGL